MSFEKVKANLESRGFVVTCFASASEASVYLAEQIKGKSVGFGGSMTAREMGLHELLGKENKIVSHHVIPEGTTREEILAEAARTDVYISSVNGLAETGEIINIDGTCNRISAIFYGHEKVYLVVGKNKIAPDYDSALWRARNIAAPLNAKRLNRKTPCAVKADRCYDCNSPDRICCGVAVMWRKPQTAYFEVVLVDEKLGY